MSGGVVEGARSVLRRPAPAAAVLLLAYVLLSLLNHAEGTLGTDTGAKVYTLEVMTERGSLRPEIGYWAEDLDPDGSVHPVYQTARTDDGWVAITTLPMLLLAAPLYDLGGYRLALLLPMLGAVGAALGARALARRIDPAGDGAMAFWVVGLASPVVVYALDLWEHALGMACVLWAVVLLLRVLDGGTSGWAVGAGALLGAGAVMRNEVLVYTLVTVGTACVTLALRRHLLRAVLAGSAAIVGFAASFLANVALEAWVGGLSRADRATGTASSATTVSGDVASRRVEEALQTSIGLVSGDPLLAAVLGGAVVAAVLLGVRAERRGDRTFALVALGAAAAVYLADAVGGLGFVPGLFIAFPLALLALMPLGRTENARIVTIMGLLALPVVYAFQFLGGAGPQWGGRYTLPSAMLLGVVGLVAVAPRLPLAGRGVIGLSLLVSALGVAWVSERTHSVDRFFDEVAEVSEPVLVARQAFLLREAGADLVDRRWLSAANEGAFLEAVSIARQLDEPALTVLEWDGEAPPPDSLPEDLVEVERRQLDFLDTPVGLVTYRFER
jgi:hypothetical protein